MTKLQKVSCIILSIFFFAVLLLVPGPFFLRGNVYRQLPLYCFLEEEATSVPQREDPETYEKLVESNAKYLADMMKAENLQSGSDDTVSYTHLLLISMVENVKELGGSGYVVQKDAEVLDEYFGG